VRKEMMSHEKAGRLMSHELWLSMLATAVRGDRTDCVEGTHYSRKA